MKWLTLLPILMQNHSGGDSGARYSSSVSREIGLCQQTTLGIQLFFLFFFKHETSLTTTITTACNVIVLSCLAGQLANLILILTKTRIVVSACSEPLWARRVELTRANWCPLWSIMFSWSVCPRYETMIAGLCMYSCHSLASVLHSLHLTSKLWSHRCGGTYLYSP